MIRLHRLGHIKEQFHLNHDMIVTVEANPDTVITLSTDAKIVVAESPEQVVQAVRDCRVEILSEAMGRRRVERTKAPEQEAEGPRLQAVEARTTTSLGEHVGS